MIPPGWPRENRRVRWALVVGYGIVLGIVLSEHAWVWASLK